MAPLPALAFFALALFALALAESGQSVAKALQNIASGIPLLGSAIGSLFGKLAQALAWAAGQLYQGIDAMMGAVFHALAWVLEQTFAMYREQAIALLHLSQYAAGQLSGVTGIRAAVRRLEQTWQGIEHGIRTLTREWHGIDRRVAKLERELAQGIGNDVRVQVKALEREVGTLESKVIPKVESAEQALQNDITALGDYIRANFVSVATDAVTAAVAVGLAGLGLAGLRCSNFKNLLSKFGCGLGSILNDLIGLALSVLALESVCTFLPVLEEAFGAVVGPMVHLLNEVPLGDCEIPPAGWASLSVAAGPQPPPQSLGTLPTG